MPVCHYITSPIVDFKSVIAFLFLFVLALANQNAHAETDACSEGVTDGLVACYPFDSNAADKTENANHGLERGNFT